MPARHDAYIHKILSDIETGRPVSQRSMSKDLGVAVGLVNLLIRRLVSKGYIKVTTIPPSRVRYALTPSGMTEKARISLAYFENTVRLYTETRERIRGRLDLISQDWTYLSAENDQKRIVFYGAGEVAEIAFVSLQSTDLKLVGIVDDSVTKPFFGMPVCKPECLTSSAVNGEAFGCVIVMSIRQAHVMQAKLETLGIPPDRVVTF